MAFPFPGHDPVKQVVEDIHHAITHHDPVRDLARGFQQHDVVDDVFASVLNDAYGRHSEYHGRRPPQIHDGFSIDFSIDFGHDRHNHRHHPHERRDRQNPDDLQNSDYGFAPLEFNRTSSELMRTLHAHLSELNVGKHRDSVTRDELRNYLVRSGDYISPQDKTDLLLVMRNFDRIAMSDGREGKGITFKDMALFVVENQREDRIVMIERQNERLIHTNARLRNEINSGRPQDGGRDGGDPRQTGRTVTDGGRVITERNGPNQHFLVSGADMPLSQEEFKAHYGIPQNIDLLKFMPGKPNDGEVPNFWSSEVAAGLGGRDDGKLRWDNPNKLDDPALNFQRNNAQLAEYFKRLPIDQQTEFIFNFARTQEPLFRAHGIYLQSVENETVSILEHGQAKRIDLVQDVNSDHKLLQWLPV